MAAKKDKMIPSEKERKRALKYATPAGTGRMWVTMGIAFIIFGIILLLIPIGLVILEASAQRYDPESIHATFTRKFSYEEKCSPQKALAEAMRLPMDKTGQPDWAYMEEYMRKMEEKTKTTLNMFCVIRNIKFDC